MHLRIDNLYFIEDRVGVDFEYDEDFKKCVAQIYGKNSITKTQLQTFIIKTLSSTIDLDLLDDIKKELRQLGN